MNSGDSKTILLVEYETLISMMGKRTLERNGFEVETAFSGEIVLEIIEKSLRVC